MIKVTFNNPQRLYVRADDPMTAEPFVCLNITTQGLTEKIRFGLKFLRAKEYIGLIDKSNIKSIEHVKPTDL